MAVWNAGKQVDCAVFHVRGVSDRIHDNVHFHIKADGVHAAYCMSKSALLSAPAMVVTKQLARELAPYILKQVREVSRG